MMSLSSGIVSVPLYASLTSSSIARGFTESREMWISARLLHAELAAHRAHERNDECFFSSFASLSFWVVYASWISMSVFFASSTISAQYPVSPEYTTDFESFSMRMANDESMCSASANESLVFSMLSEESLSISLNVSSKPSLSMLFGYASSVMSRTYFSMPFAPSIVRGVSLFSSRYLRSRAGSPKVWSAWKCEMKIVFILLWMSSFQMRCIAEYPQSIRRQVSSMKRQVFAWFSSNASPTPIKFIFIDQSLGTLIL